MQSNSGEPELMVAITYVSGLRLKIPYHHLWNNPGCPASLLEMYPQDIPSQPGNVELPKRDFAVFPGHCHLNHAIADDFIPTKRECPDVGTASGIRSLGVKK